MRSNKKRQRERSLAIITMLAERWPAVFAVRDAKRRPLAIGIRDDILAALDPKELVGALRYYCRSVGYLSHMRSGAWRHDLDGNVVGTVMAEEQAVAQAWLAEMKVPPFYFDRALAISDAAMPIRRATRTPPNRNFRNPRARVAIAAD
jgi:sRNA-binding protein